MMDLNTVQGKILAGNLLFAVCCAVYLIWWSVAFRPGYTAPMMVKSALHGEGVFTGRAFAVIAAVVLAAAAAGMICYLKYYDLPPMTAFYDGMVPLILFALVMIGISGYQLLGAK